MGHKNRKTLVKQVSDELDSQFRAGKGRQKHIDKHVENGMDGRIYTDTTLRGYKKHCCYFVNNMDVRRWRSAGSTSRSGWGLDRSSQRGLRNLRDALSLSCTDARLRSWGLRLLPESGRTSRGVGARPNMINISQRRNTRIL